MGSITSNSSASEGSVDRSPQNRDIEITQAELVPNSIVIESQVSTQVEEMASQIKRQLIEDAAQAEIVSTGSEGKSCWKRRGLVACVRVVALLVLEAIGATLAVLLPGKSGEEKTTQPDDTMQPARLVALQEKLAVAFDDKLFDDTNSAQYLCLGMASTRRSNAT